MSRILLLFSCLLPLAAPLHAAEPEDPNVAANAKLREALRSTMLQLRTAQTETAKLQAEKTAADAKVAELTKKSDALAKQAAEDQALSKKKIEELTVGNDDLEKNVARLEETLAKWKDGYAKAAEVARAKETERAKLADEKSILQAKVRDHKTQNLELHRLANEILTRYEKFSVGDALKAREPFTGLTRAKLDSQIQDYRDKVEDARIPAEPAKKAAPASASR
jgi:chromosome segregation ATPase